MPDNLAQGQGCVRLQMDKPEGRWDDIDCVNPNFRVGVCEVAAKRKFGDTSPIGACQSKFYTCRRAGAIEMRQGPLEDKGGSRLPTRLHLPSAQQ